MFIFQLETNNFVKNNSQTSRIILFPVIIKVQAKNFVSVSCDLSNPSYLALNIFSSFIKKYSVKGVMISLKLTESNLHDQVHKRLLHCVRSRADNIN